MGIAAASPFPLSGELLGGLSMLALARQFTAGKRVRPHWALVAFLAWCAVSLLWSQSWLLTGRGFLITATSSLAVVALVRHNGVIGTARAVTSTFKVLLLLSLFLYFAYPQGGRTQDVYQAGALEGVFNQRNLASFVAVLAFLTFLALSRNPGRGATGEWPLVWAGVSLAVVVLTQSGTGLAVGSVTGLLVGLFALIQKSTSMARSIAVGAAAVVTLIGIWWVTANVTTISRLIGRDETLTGRTVIWEAIGPAISESYLTGYGWAALWTPRVPVTEAMWNAGGFRFYHAHNAYLELQLQVGLIGLLLALAILARTALAAGLIYVGEGGPWATWCLGVPVALSFYGFTELSFVSHFGWLYLLVVLTVATSMRSSDKIVLTQ